MSRPLAGLGELAEAARERLAATHEAREAALAASRAAIRASSVAIRAVHRGELTDAATHLDEASVRLAEAHAAAADHPRIAHAGFVLDAEKEVAEAATTLAVIGGGVLPGPDALGVEPAAWLNGLAETVGELRRSALDSLRAGDHGQAESLLAAMDEILAVLASIDFPDGVTAGLRRATDVARSITERTRGDVTTALVGERLQTALSEHRRDVLEG